MEALTGATTAALKVGGDKYMERLPILNTTDKDLLLMQTRWSAIINQLLTDPFLNGNNLTDIKILTGTNVINHKLARKLQGWIITGQSASASIYDNQATNQTTDKTLVLVSDNPCVIALRVF